MYTGALWMVLTMDTEYMWIVSQGKNCHQFMLLTWTLFISQFVRLVEGEGMGVSLF